MKTMPLKSLAVLILFLVTSSLASTDPGSRPYKHPDRDIHFTAESGWRHQPRPGDEGTHELVDPESGIHVLMWATTTEMNARAYLSKMSHMMDLELTGESRVRLIDHRESRVLSVPGKIGAEDVHSLLAVIPAGRSRLHPRETILHVVQIWCPVAEYLRLESKMEHLLESVRITDRVIHEGKQYGLYPETTLSPPDLPSPLQTADGLEYVTVRLQSGDYALVPVTVENGAPNDYGNNQWDKGRQLQVDTEDFPTLATGGLHDDSELARTKTITGRPVETINIDARPGGLSSTGFIADDEDILSVIKDDNRTVRRLGLTHARLAQPLFKLFNVILRDLELYRRQVVPPFNITTVLYAGHEIDFTARGGKGWQESIFEDTVLGYWRIELSRTPTYRERKFLQERYGHLGPQRLARLEESLFSIHTGEMVPFYIQKYGFYEGHTSYRADPIAIALVFGIAEIGDIDTALGQDLADYLDH